MEYIIVRFDPHDPRDVLANGDVIGRTGIELMLPSDFYLITLSGDGYTPEQWEGPVSGTQPTTPLRIVFTRA